MEYNEPEQIYEEGDTHIGIPQFHKWNYPTKSIYKRAYC